MDSTHPTIARFYDAMWRADAAALVETLADDFVGHVSEGIPAIGGRHHGADAMLRNAWIPAYTTYGVTPRPEEVLTTGADRVVVLGNYEGTLPGRGQPFTAAFAHVIRLRGDRISELRQITDSGRWVATTDADSASTAVVRSVFEAVRTRDLDLLLEAYSDGVVIEEDPALPYGGIHRGRQGAIDHAIGFATAWDQLQDRRTRDPQERILADAQSPKAFWTLRAAHGDQQFNQPAASLFQIRDGKVAHLQMLHADSAAIMRFLRASR